MKIVEYKKENRHSKDVHIAVEFNSPKMGSTAELPPLRKGCNLQWGYILKALTPQSTFIPSNYSEVHIFFI